MSDNPKLIAPDYWRFEQSTDASYVERTTTYRAMAANPGEVITALKTITIKASLLDVADAIAKPFGGALKGDNYKRMFFQGFYAGVPVLGIVSNSASSRDYDPDEDDGPDDDTPSTGDYLRDAYPEDINSFQIRITGPREAIAVGFAAMDVPQFRERNFGQLQWHYAGGAHRQHTKTIYLPPLTTKLHPEYYPDLDGGPEKFISDYLAADESVLLMAGPPGTGKTTLLRHMIMDHSLSAHVCYDEKLMQSDDMFQSFLLNSNGALLIIEDADTILAPRERDGNHMMSRFLNVSDGLIKLPNKKLIFTTNLTDFGKVDPALLRPGRCYAVMQTRPLDLQEAQAASRVGGFPTPTEKKQYTLAELFNQGRSRGHVRRIGYNT